MFESLSGAELLTIAVVALVVFGPGRLPEIARTIGRYVRELRAAVTDLRRGIEQEIGPIREPLEEVKKDLSKPVADVRRTLAETADAAKTAEREVKKSVKDAAGAGDSGSAAPGARWIAPPPPTGVSPGEAWKGVGDPMPDAVHPPRPDDSPAPGGLDEAGAPAGSAENPPRVERDSDPEDR